MPALTGTDQIQQVAKALGFVLSTMIIRARRIATIARRKAKAEVQSTSIIVHCGTTRIQPIVRTYPIRNVIRTTNSGNVSNISNRAISTTSTTYKRRRVTIVGTVTVNCSSDRENLSPALVDVRQCPSRLPMGMAKTRVFSISFEERTNTRTRMATPNPRRIR